MDEPGWISGNRISSSPVAGPLDRSRMSLAMRMSSRASVLSQAAAAPSGQRLCIVSKGSRPPASGSLASSAYLPHTLRTPESSSQCSRPCRRRCRQGGFGEGGLHRRQCFENPVQTGGVRPELRPECDRHRVLEVRTTPTWRSHGTPRPFDEGPRSDLTAARTSASANSVATCAADGKVSFVDCPKLTWSFGLTAEYSPRGLPRSSSARLASTSLTFMWKEVPAPAWNTSTTNWSRNSPVRHLAGGLLDGLTPVRSRRRGSR